MSFLSTTARAQTVFLMAFLFIGGFAGTGARAAGDFASESRPLPDVRVRSVAAGKDVSLAGTLAGRPAVILLTDGSGPPACSVGRAAAELQSDYGPWFSWVAVLSGSFTITDLEAVRASSPVRFERLYLDRAGALGASLGIARLPALLLVDEDGAVRDVCSPDGSIARFEEVAEKIQALAAGSRRRRAGFDDFRLPQVGRPELVSFLDVVGREHTIVSFLHSGCLPCARQLEVLDFLRDRHAGQANLVTVFLDDAADARIRGFLGAAGVTPDFILRDPEMRLAGRYGIDTVPTLLVIDTAGAITFSRSGYREQERNTLYRDLERAFIDGAPAVGTADPALQEASRLHAEACAFLREGKPEFALIYQERIRELLPGYPSVNLRIAEAALAAGHRDLAVRSLARYLAAQPQTYDSPDVRQMIAGLLVPEPEP
jgi:thiol-disulfide isomerase/thioredoxin